MPTFVPVDFESTSLTEGLGATAFDPKRRTLFSWMNTIPYLTESATEATLREIAALVAPASRIALNYAFPRDSSSPRLAPETGVRSRRPNTAQEFALRVGPDGGAESKCLQRVERKGNDRCGPASGNARSHPPMSTETRQRLSRFYEPFNLVLYELLGVDYGWH